MYTTKEKKRDLKLISAELNLIFETQDWGIINSDSDRLTEFINCFYSPHDISIKYELFKLIVASYNDAILEGKNTPYLNTTILDFFNQNKQVNQFKPIIDYWKKIYSDENPVGKVFENKI